MIVELLLIFASAVALVVGFAALVVDSFRRNARPVKRAKIFYPRVLPQ